MESMIGKSAVRAVGDTSAARVDHEPRGEGHDDDQILRRSGHPRRGPKQERLGSEPATPLDPQPHGAFWRRTGDYDLDYTEFTSGNVPKVGLPIVKKAPGEELQSIFYVILTDPNGLPNEGMPQMPAGGPYITDAGYQVDVNGVTMTG
jgi:hypothetical protein